MSIATETETSYPIRPYSPDSRIDEVESRIREYINNNNLQPGHRLPAEAWFAAQLDVGRPLIREAMKGLEAVGMIEARKGVGRFVRAFDPDAYLRTYTASMLLSSFSETELAETRCILEISLVADAVRHLTDDDLEEIERHWQRLQEATERAQPDSEADMGLHRIIMRRAGNQLIVAMLDAVTALALRSREERGVDLHKMRHDLDEHAEIVAAVRRRDGPAARQALGRHFTTTAARLGFAHRWQQVFPLPEMEVHTGAGNPGR